MYTNMYFNSLCMLLYILIRFSGIPPDEDTSTGYSECEYYVLPYDNLTEDDIWDWNWDAGPVFRNETDIDECDAWVYDQSEFTKTAVSEVNVEHLFKL